MPIEYVSGDLFVNRYGAKALAHGCNCQGSMGAGVATGFRDRYPDMYAEYRRKCKAEPRQFNLGDAWLWKANDRPWVFNLGTQEGYCHAAHRRWLRRAIVEEGAADHRTGLRRLAVYPGRV